LSLKLIGPLSIVALLVGCENPNGVATIHYEQLGACNGYQDGSTAVSSGPSAAYVLFKINSIDNRNEKVSFNCEPSKVCAPSSPTACVSTTLSLAQKIGLGTTTVVVPAGTNLQHNGFAVIVAPTANSPDPQVEANKVNYLLTYARAVRIPGLSWTTRIPARRNIRARIVAQ
jgi:hypothetical protein